MTYYIAKLLSTIFFTVQTPKPPYTLAEKVGLWLACFSVFTAVGSLIALAMAILIKII